MLKRQFATARPVPAEEIREKERLEAVERLDLLDAPRDQSFDLVARLLRSVFDVQVAAISVLDAHRQVFKACEGMAGDGIDIRQTFCAHAIKSDAPTIVPDATLDARFVDNPLVTAKDGIRFYAAAPLQTSDGHNVGTVCIADPRPRIFSARETDLLRDFADLAMQQLELRRLAKVDALTGALSRRAFRAQSEQAVSLALRHRHDLSLIAFDLDHFKRINDTYGHAAGDEVLASVTELCAGAVRGSEILGRVGGEEFCIALPHTGMQGALELAERLRGLVASMPFEPNGRSCRVTASFGVAALDSETRDLETLLSRADAALYEAKANGRNCVVGSRGRSGAGQQGRRRVLKAATIHFNRRNSTMDCTIRSLGEDGAGIDVSSAHGLPDTFDLTIRSDGTEHQCRITAHGERHIEVAFI